MKRKSATIEWTVGDNESMWQTRATHAPDHIASHSRKWGLFLLTCLLVLLLAGGWIWQRQVRLARVAAELQARMVEEVSAKPDAGQPNIALPSVSGAPSPGQFTPSGWQANTLGYASSTQDQPTVQMHSAQIHDVQIHDIHIESNRVLAQATVRYAATSGVGNQSLTYRETHFYRQTAAGWERTSPDPDLLGPVQTLETAHFTIRHRAMDAGAVTKAAPNLDKLYDSMRYDFGLSTGAGLPKIAIEVTATELPAGSVVDATARTITLPSPSVLSAPVEWPAHTVFYQSMVYPLSGLLVEEAKNVHAFDTQRDLAYWQPVWQAARLWVLWQDSGPLATWREDIVHWLYHNQTGHITPSSAIKALPHTYASLCRAHRVWSLSPWEMSIPLFCNEMDELLWLSWSYPHLPDRLDELTAVNEHRPPPAVSMGSMVASVVGLETVLEYVVATYGHEQLPALLSALGQHRTWETLLPAVFEVSATDFQAGWHAYLADRYQ